MDVWAWGFFQESNSVIQYGNGKAFYCSSRKIIQQLNSFWCFIVFFSLFFSHFPLSTIPCVTLTSPFLECHSPHPSLCQCSRCLLRTGRDSHTWPHIAPSDATALSSVLIVSPALVPLNLTIALACPEIISKRLATWKTFGSRLQLINKILRIKQGNRQLCGQFNKESINPNLHT